MSEHTNDKQPTENEQEKATVDAFADLTVGRIVHFVMAPGEHRPAIVVRLFNFGRENGMANLMVFTDGENDAALVPERVDVLSSPGGTPRPAVPPMIWRTSVHYAPPSECQMYTWHWPERV